MAVAAAYGGVEGDTVAFLPGLDVSSYFGDLAGGFVAHHQGRNAASGGAIEAVDVAAADSTGFDADEDVVGSDLGLGEVGHFEFHVLFEEESLHSRIPFLPQVKSTAEGCKSRTAVLSSSYFQSVAVWRQVCI